MSSIRVVDRIGKRVEQCPDAPAVEWLGRQLSYAELWRRSVQVAKHLGEAGLRSGAPAGLLADKSIHSIPSLLGIWLAGGVAVPLYQKTTGSVLAGLIEEIGMQHFFCDRQGLSDLALASKGLTSKHLTIVSMEGPCGSGLEWGTPVLRTSIEEVLRSSAEGFTPSQSHTDRAYIFFTSGSEGAPKGVMGSHRGLDHYIQWQAEALGHCQQDRFSQIAPHSFDFCLKEILVPLATGGSVFLADRETVLDPLRFIEWGGERGITVMSLIPALFRSLYSAFPLAPEPLQASFLSGLRQVLVSGDVLRWEDVRRWRKTFADSVQLTNLYGPTESTVIKLFYPIPPGVDQDSGIVPLGKPIKGAHVKVLDSAMRPCPKGQTGEIHILSDFIAEGYVNSAQSGQSKFYMSEEKGRFVRAYRSGDLGCINEDGNIEFGGRRDRQIKSAGHRIDLNSIESRLARQDEVEDVSACVLQNGHAKQLVCFFVSHSADFTEAHLKGYAREALLPYLVPDRFIRLDAFPLTQNGKVDSQQLVRLAKEHSSNSNTGSQGNGAQSGTLAKVLATWRRLLEVDQIDSEDNFFELGGNSMLALEALQALRTEIHTAISMKDLFDHPTAAGLCKSIDASRQN